MTRILVLGLTLLVSINIALSQNVLDQYISTALKSNIAVQQKELSYEKSLLALEEAKALFFPKLSLEARYSRALGGRTIDFPIGDLFNPVYNNLNLINERNSSVNPDYPTIPIYPEVENQAINFLRTSEQETKLRLVYPIFNTKIRNNKKIKKGLVQVEKITVDIYKRELVKEVKVAYYNYLMALEAFKLFENTKELVEENLRTSESLVKNHKSTIDVVFAAKAQVKSVEQQLAEAKKNEQTAKAYFNFLLNKKYDAEIQQAVDLSKVVSVDNVKFSRNKAIKNREELKQLNQYLGIAEQNIQLERGAKRPQLNLVGDYGIQGKSYAFGKDDDFAMASLVLSWNLFDKPVKAKIEQAQIDKTILAKQKMELQQQIGLQVVNAFYDLEAARAKIDLAKAEMESTQQVFKLVNKKFKQSQANLVELTEARTQMTNASQKHIIAKFDYEVKLANLERATGTYDF